MSKNVSGAWDISSGRFPSRQDTLSVFAACVIPVFVWAILSYLDAFPGLALRENVWDLVGSASYVLGFALIESVVVLLPLLLLAILLPARWLRVRFAALGSAIVLVSALWAGWANSQRVDPVDLAWEQWLLFLVLYFVSLAVVARLIVRSPRLEQALVALLRRAALLAYVYVGLGCLALGVVVLRNI